MNYTEILGGMRRYYGEGRTQSFEARRKSLEKLEQGLKRWGSRLERALAEDLGKASMEAYMTELGQVREELRWQKKHLKQNMAVKRAPAPMAQAPAKSLRWPHPYGVVLVMAPWNYPVLLSLGPLVGAVAAGNCVVLKPSAYAPKTAETLAAKVSEVFDKGHVQVVTGGRAENQAHPSGKIGAGEGRPASDAGDIGTGRQKPLYRGGGRRSFFDGPADRFRQIGQLRPDLCGS